MFCGISRVTTHACSRFATSCSNRFFLVFRKNLTMLIRKLPCCRTFLRDKVLRCVYWWCSRALPKQTRKSYKLLGALVVSDRHNAKKAVSWLKTNHPNCGSLFTPPMDIIMSCYMLFTLITRKEREPGLARMTPLAAGYQNHLGLRRWYSAAEGVTKFTIEHLSTTLFGLLLFAF